MDGLALKLPMTTIKYGFLFKIWSKLSSKLSANFSKTSSDWLGERYTEIKLHNLRPNDISKFMHSSKQEISNTFKTKEWL